MCYMYVSSREREADETETNPHLLTAKSTNNAYLTGKVKVACHLEIGR